MTKHSKVTMAAIAYQELITAQQVARDTARENLIMLCTNELGTVNSIDDAYNLWVHCPKQSVQREAARKRFQELAVQHAERLSTFTEVRDFLKSLNLPRHFMETKALIALRMIKLADSLEDLSVVGNISFHSWYTGPVKDVHDHIQDEWERRATEAISVARDIHDIWRIWRNCASVTGWWRVAGLKDKLLNLFPTQEAFSAALATATPQCKERRSNFMRFCRRAYERK